MFFVFVFSLLPDGDGHRFGRSGRVPRVFLSVLCILGGFRLPLKRNDLFPSCFLGIGFFLGRELYTNWRSQRTDQKVADCHCTRNSKKGEMRERERREGGYLRDKLHPSGGVTSKPLSPVLMLLINSLFWWKVSTPPTFAVFHLPLFSPPPMQNALK